MKALLRNKPERKSLGNFVISEMTADRCNQCLDHAAQQVIDMGRREELFEDPERWIEVMDNGSLMLRVVISKRVTANIVIQPEEWTWCN